MKRYVNKTNHMGLVEFEDGSGQFLQRGQAFESDKKVKRMSKGIEVTEPRGAVAVRVSKPRATASEAKD